MKRWLTLLLVLLVGASAVEAAYRYNPFTKKQDYYQRGPDNVCIADNQVALWDNTNQIFFCGGISGVGGPTGAQGAQGPAGADGAPGEQGPQGLPGTLVGDGTESPSFLTVTAGEFISSAADNTRGATVPNTADPTGANLAAGKIWYNTTSSMAKVRNADNTATQEIFTSGAAHTLNFATSGTLMGAIKVLTDNTTPAAADLYGVLFLWTQAGTTTLPQAVAGMSACMLDSGTAHDLILDVNAADDIEMTAGQQTNGVGITNASGSSTADYVCVIAPTNGHWVVMGSRGTWASQ